MKAETIIDAIALILAVVFINARIAHAIPIDTGENVSDACGLIALSWLYAKHVFSRKILVPG